MTSGTPIAVLASTDRTDRDALVMTALLDAPGVVAILHDLEQDDDGEVVLRRRVWGPTATAPTTTPDGQIVPMEHACPGCALREDAVPAIADLLADGGVTGILLALPIGAEIMPATRTLLAAAGPENPLAGVRLGLTTTLVDGTDVVDRLHDGDDAVLAQLYAADQIVVADPSPLAGDVVDALRWNRSLRHDDSCDPWLTVALAGQHDDADLEKRHDPVSLTPGRGFVEASIADDGAHVAPSGAWTLELRSTRPFHPERLLEGVQQLAAECTVSRGRFWLPNRPDAVCGWEATGGTVCVGVAGPWDGPTDTTDTYLIVTGTHEAGRSRLRRAFDRALLTDDELAEGPAAWLGRPDPLEVYLGAPADLYK